MLLLSLPRDAPLACRLLLCLGMSPRCGPYHSGEGLCFSPVTSGIGLHRDNCSLASGSMGASPQSWWGCIMPPGHPRLALSSFLLYLSLKPWLGSCRGEALSEEIHRRSFLKTVLLHPSSQLASVWVAEEPSGAGEEDAGLMPSSLWLTLSYTSFQNQRPPSPSLHAPIPQWWQLSSGGQIHKVMGRGLHQEGRLVPLPPLPSFCHGWPSPPWTWCPH